MFIDLEIKMSKFLSNHSLQQNMVVDIVSCNQSCIDGHIFNCYATTPQSGEICVSWRRVCAREFNFYFSTNYL